MVEECAWHKISFLRGQCFATRSFRSVDYAKRDCFSLARRHSATRSKGTEAQTSRRPRRRCSAAEQSFRPVAVGWRARDVHPWDRDLPPGCQAELFLEQTLRDTDAAILNLFQTLPEIEQIAIRVLDARDSTKVILGGVVTREDALATDASASLRLRLRMLGIQYSRIVDGQLEPLSNHSRPVLAVA